jgi:hypothetical protein
MNNGKQIVLGHNERGDTVKTCKGICILALLHQGSTYYGSIIPHLSKGAKNNKITIMPTVISEN